MINQVSLCGTCEIALCEESWLEVPLGWLHCCVCLMYMYICWQIRELSRADVEKDLKFCGFIALSCPLKADSKVAIREIQHSSHYVRTRYYSWVFATRTWQLSLKWLVIATLLAHWLFTTKLRLSLPKDELCTFHWIKGTVLYFLMPALYSCVYSCHLICKLYLGWKVNLYL